MSLAKHSNYTSYSKYLKKRNTFFIIASFVDNNKKVRRYEKA